MLGDYEDKLGNVRTVTAFACFRVNFLIQNEKNETKLT